MSWEDRLLEAIYLISPSGVEFTAAWTGNDRSLEKKLGIFEFAEARGAVVQDLDVGAARYPLNFFFHGADHDIDAARFYEACKERGVWLVFHPVHGQKVLQLVSVTEKVQPVTSGGITEFDTDWIEPGVNLPEVSIAEVTATVYGAIQQLEDAAVEQFTSGVETKSFLAKLLAAVFKIIAIVKSVTALVSGIVSAVTQVVKTIMGIVNAIVVSVAALASAIVSLITLPATLMKDTKSRMQYFKQVLSASFRLKPKSVEGGAVNVARTVELVAVAVASGVAQALVQAEPTSREEIVQYLDDLDSIFLDIVNNLDDMQTVYADNFIDRQYFSQSQSFTDLMRLLTLLRQLLLIRSFDLSTAKYLTLRKDRAPIEIAITEGVDLDAFIAYNRLKGDEILLLPTGRQVVVYL